MLQTVKGFVRERLDVTDSARGMGSVGRDLMLQRVQGGKGRWCDVILQTVQGGKLSVGRDLKLQSVQGGKVC